MTDNDIIIKFWNKKNPSLRKYLCGHENIEEYIVYLKNRFFDCTDIHEALYRIKYNIKERPKCPICGKTIQYNDKLHRFNQFCSRICANKNPKLIENRQATMLKKYGVTAVAKLDSVKQKLSDTWKNKSQDELDNIRNKQIKTNLKKYGVEYPGQSKEVKDKIKQTNIERYGVECTLHAEEIKDKIKQTNLERYGVECTLHAEEIKDKVKQTNLERYGVECTLQAKEVRDKIKQTNLERYGFENPAQAKEVKDKIKQTNIERYGVECVFYLDEYRDKEKHISLEARQKAVNTIFERYGKDNYANREKAKQTCLERYGVESKFKLPEFKEHIYNIMYEKYGVKHALQNTEIMNKFKNTCLERYGETHHFKTEYYRKLLSDIISSEECTNKRKQTNLERFGVEHILQLEYFKNKYKKSVFSHYGVDNPFKSKELQQKAHETKKKNGSYSKSKEEDYVYSVLVDIYGENNVERQYSSELYPFACDFYIISEDLYIEYNGMWTHGHTPYIGSKENEIQLEKWKQKAETSDYYKSAIVTWTISDVKKRNTAKENNLNYIEIWNILDINNYFKI